MVDLLRAARLGTTPAIQDNEKKQQRLTPIRAATNRAEPDQSILSSLASTGLSGLAKVGNFLDLPGSVVRDVSTWLPGGIEAQNPVDQFLSPFTSENRVSGEDMLQSAGLAGENTWGGLAGGIATEIALDPLTYLSFGASAVGKAGTAAGKAGLTKNAKSVANELAGRTLGKESGKRLGATSARQTLTPRNLIDAAADPAEAMKRFKVAGGTDAMLDEKLGGVAKFSVPFLSKRYGDTVPALRERVLGTTDLTPSQLGAKPWMKGGDGPSGPDAGSAAKPKSPLDPNADTGLKNPTPEEFSAISPNHARFNQELDGLQQSGILDDADSEILRGIFSQSDLGGFDRVYFRPVKEISPEATPEIVSAYGANVPEIGGAATKTPDGGFDIQLSQKALADGNYVDTGIDTLVHEIGHAFLETTKKPQGEAGVDVVSEFDNLIKDGTLGRYFSDNYGPEKAAYFGQNPHEAFAQLFADSVIKRKGQEMPKPIESFLGKVRKFVSDMLSKVLGNKQLSGEARLRTDAMIDLVGGFIGPDQYKSIIGKADSASSKLDFYKPATRKMPGIEPDATGMFSQVARSLDAIFRESSSLPADQMLARLRKMPGVKEEEIADLGLDKLSGKRLSRNDITDHLSKNMLTMEEAINTGDRAGFSDLAVPGGDDGTYRELILKANAGGKRIEGGADTHWMGDDSIAHIRLDDVSLANGEKILRVNEIQSDWIQGLRKFGTKTEDLQSEAKSIKKEMSGNAVELFLTRQQIKQLGENAPPELLAKEQSLTQSVEQASSRITQIGKMPADAPMKKSWDSMAIKKIFDYAVANGYD